MTTTIPVECVNSLNRVLSISTIWKINVWGMKLSCVNSLNRVLSISTVSSHSPLKSRLSSLIFAGNCLNILKMTFFSLIFWLFKNCTDINTIFYVFYSSTYSILFQYKRDLFQNFVKQVFLNLYVKSAFNWLTTVSVYFHLEINSLRRIKNIQTKSNSRLISMNWLVLSCFIVSIPLIG